MQDDWWSAAPVVDEIPATVAQTSPVRAAPMQAAPARQSPQYQGELPTDVNAVFPALVAQESGGRAGVLGPMTQYGQAIGRTQMLPATAREMAERVGVPFDESMLRGTSPEAAAYQDRLGLEYLKQGFEQTGNMRDALRYYHGGPNRRLWGPKTQAYSEEVLGRLGSGDIAPVSTAMSEAVQGDDWWSAAPVAEAPAAPANALGASRDNPVDLGNIRYEDEVQALRKGAWAKDAQGNVFQLEGDAFTGSTRPEDEAQSGNILLRRPNFTDTATAAVAGASEQIPFLDESQALTAGLLSGEGYSAMRDIQRDQRARQGDTNETARNVGGVAGFAGSLAIPAAGIGFIRQGANVSDKIGRAGLVGSATGAVMSGAAADGGANERIQAAVNGALWGYGTGAVLGGVAPIVAPRVLSGLSEAGSTITRGLGIAPRDAEITQQATDSALEYVRRLAEGSGNDLSANALAALGKPITAAEAIGPSGVSNMAALTRRSGRAGQMAQDQLGARAVEAPNRVVQDFADLTGMDPSGSADMIQNLATAGRRRAAPLYDAAYATPVRITDDIQEILDTPAGKRALGNAVTIARNERIDPSTLGFDFNEAGDVINIRQPSVRTLDFVKRGLDDVLDGYRDGTTRRLNLTNESRPVVGLVTDLRDAMVRLTGGETGTYAQALAAGGDPIRLEQAFTQAPRLFQSGTSLRDFRAAIGKMGEAERNSLVAGYADRLYNDAAGGRLGTRQLGQLQLPVTQQKLGELLGDDAARSFMERIGAERSMAATGNRMAPGTNSVTAEALAAMQEQDRGVGILNDLARNVETSGVIGGATRTAADAIAAPVAGFVRGFASPAPQPVRDEIARLLMGPPEELQAMLNRSSRQGGGDALSRVLDGEPLSGRFASSRPGARNATPRTRRAQ